MIKSLPIHFTGHPLVFHMAFNLGVCSECNIMTVSWILVSWLSIRAKEWRGDTNWSEEEPNSKFSKLIFNIRRFLKTLWEWRKTKREIFVINDNSPGL